MDRKRKADEKRQRRFARRSGVEEPETADAPEDPLTPADAAEEPDATPAEPAPREPD